MVMTQAQAQSHRAPAPPGRAATLRVGILGANGIVGAELAGLLLRHPRLQLRFATSRSQAGRRLNEVDPAAPGLILCHPDEAELSGVDWVFSCLPHGRGAESTARALEAGARVIDLSADFRLADAATHERSYGSPRSPELAREAIYGLTEQAREALPSARLIACPGCYPTSVATPLWPIAELICGPVIVNSASGVTGAGRKATATTHFCSAADDLRPYKVGRLHRHVAEMEQSLARAAGRAAPPVIFTPHLAPLQRGILSTIVIETRASAADIHARLAARYATEPFVTVLELGEPARIRAAAHTNRVIIGVHPTEAGLERVILTCAIDNIVKGAAGQALQNLNAAMRWPETLGLEAGLDLALEERP